MSNEKLIKKYFDFLKRKGFRRKELFRNGDSEITYSKKGMSINVCCELGISYVPLSDIFAEFSKNASYVVSVIIKHGHQVDNLLYCDLFEKQIRMRLKSDIDKVENQDIEQILKIYSQFIMDNVFCIG